MSVGVDVEEAVRQEDAGDDGFEPGGDDGDEGDLGAAIALFVALLSFLLAVAFVILRHVLFHAP